MVSSVIYVIKHLQQKEDTSTTCILTLLCEFVFNVNFVSNHTLALIIWKTISNFIMALLLLSIEICFFISCFYEYIDYNIFGKCFQVVFKKDYQVIVNKILIELCIFRFLLCDYYYCVVGLKFYINFLCYCYFLHPFNCLLF